MSELPPVTMMDAATRLDYVFTAGVAMSKNLHGYEQGKFIGQRCPKCGKVYIPSRGSCPSDGVATDEIVELPNTGHDDDVLRGERAVRRAVDRDPVHLRRRSSSTGPTSRSWG